jgi:hypothetical protein
MKSVRVKTVRLTMAWGILVPILATVGCGDEKTTPPQDLSALDPPAAGQGFQLVTDETVVPYGTEEQDCYFFRVGDLAAAAGLDATQAVNLHRVQIAQRSGSHHMNIFRVRTVVKLGPDGGAVQRGQDGTGECFKSPNWADWPLLANSQESGAVDWTYPEGVANRLDPDEWLMLQTHYVNASTQKTLDAGRVRVNLWSIPDGEVTAEMGTLFATKQSIRICASNPQPTFQGACNFNATNPVHVIGANGHFHSRGREFDMYAWDGTTVAQPDDGDRFYQSMRWDEPPMMHSPELDLTIPAGGGVFYTCAFSWHLPADQIGCSGLDAFDGQHFGTPASDQDCCYTFGPLVDFNEHCNAFVYYYPKQDDVNCF